MILKFVFYTHIATKRKNVKYAVHYVLLLSLLFVSEYFIIYDSEWFIHINLSVCIESTFLFKSKSTTKCSLRFLRSI